MKHKEAAAMFALIGAAMIGTGAGAISLENSKANLPISICRRGDVSPNHLEHPENSQNYPNRSGIHCVVTSSTSASMTASIAPNRSIQEIMEKLCNEFYEV